MSPLEEAIEDLKDAQDNLAGAKSRENQAIAGREYAEQQVKVARALVHSLTAPVSS